MTLGGEVLQPLVVDAKSTYISNKQANKTQAPDVEECHENQTEVDDKFFPQHKTKQLNQSDDNQWIQTHFISFELPMVK